MARRNPTTTEDLIQFAIDARDEGREGWFAHASRMLVGELDAQYLGRRSSKSLVVAQCIREITAVSATDPAVSQWLYRIWGKSKISAALKKRKSPYVIMSRSTRFSRIGEIAFFPATADDQEVSDTEWPAVLDGQSNKGAFAERADFRGVSIAEALQLIGVTHIVRCGAQARERDNPAGRTMRIGELPRDMREELFNLHATSVDPEATQRRFDDRRVPVVEIEIAAIDVRDYARSAHLKTYDPLQLPPVIIASGKLVDGGHRVAAAQRRGIHTLQALDLTGLLDPDSTGFVAEL